MGTIRHLVLPNHAYFVTTRAKDTAPVLTEPTLAKIILSTIYHCRETGHLYLYAFVLMPDHLHLLINPRNQTTSALMHRIKGFSSYQINQALRTHGSIWQARFIDFPLDNHPAFWTRVEYIHNNPVRKGLVNEATTYPYSTANPIWENDIDKV